MPFAFAFISSFHLLVWLILFFAKKDLRRPILLMSIFFAGAGPISEFLSISDYWNPGFLVTFSVYSPDKTWTFGFEDLIGSFSCVGIYTAAFELLYPKRESK